MVTQATVLAWRIPGMEEPGGIQFAGSQRVGHEWSNWASTYPIFVEATWNPEIPWDNEEGKIWSLVLLDAAHEEWKLAWISHFFSGVKFTEIKAPIFFFFISLNSLYRYLTCLGREFVKFLQVSSISCSHMTISSIFSFLLKLPTTPPFFSFLTDEVITYFMEKNINLPNFICNHTSCIPSCG